MYKSIIIITLITVGILGLMIWGQSAQKSIGSNTGVASVLTTTEKLYDFGTISMKDGNVTKEFIVNNLTDKDVFVPTIVTSCMCTQAFIVESDGTTKGPFKMPSMGYVPPANETVKAGGSFVVRAVYDPNAHGPSGVGKIDRFITITDKSGATLQLEIKAIVTP